jgi:chorismate mutase
VCERVKHSTPSQQFRSRNSHELRLLIFLEKTRMNSDEQIKKYRSAIDELDRRLLRLLNRRMLICERIGLLKWVIGIPLRDRGRESSVIARLHSSNEGRLDNTAVNAIFRQIVRESRRMQKVCGQGGKRERTSSDKGRSKL